MKIGLFIPCYVNAMFPEAGIATYKLLKHFGADVEYPTEQTCCGQPMANAGFEDKAVPVVGHFERLFGKYDYIVGPSASCVSFIRHNHSSILSRNGLKSTLNQNVKVYEIVEFLHDILKIKSLPGEFNHKVSVHNSCHGVRELNLSSASELNSEKYSKIIALLSLVKGIDVVEPEKVDECCGFGGMFSIEEPGISVRMGGDKVSAHVATGAKYITGADSSCLLHMDGVIGKTNQSIKTIHVAEILASGL